MDIYVNNCLSLPEQVEKNRRDIIDMMSAWFLEHFNYKEIELNKTQWVDNDSNYKYTYNDNEITENSLVLITTNSNDTMFYLINSINNGFEIYSKNKPNENITCYIWFNNKNENE